jgi:ATP-dependent Clp protease ATP-binding subunit ClpC
MLLQIMKKATFRMPRGTRWIPQRHHRDDVKHRRGYDQRQSSLGFALSMDENQKEQEAYEDMRKKLLDSLKRVFRPEFINRLDNVIVFRALAREHIRHIVSWNWIK